MEKKLKAKWVKALRSKEYKQGTGRLRNADTNEYCCLGVLCDISGLGNWKIGLDGSYYKYEEHGRAGVLVPKLLKVVGLIEAEQANLYNLNDDDGKDFYEIADYIEENL